MALSDSDCRQRAVLPAALLLLSCADAARRRSRARGAAPRRSENLDTVQAWPPEAARVLTIAERRAYDLLRSARCPVS